MGDCWFVFVYKKGIIYILFKKIAKITNGKAYRNFIIFTMLQIHLFKYQLFNHVLNYNDANVKTRIKFSLWHELANVAITSTKESFRTKGLEYLHEE